MQLNSPIKYSSIGLLLISLFFGCGQTAKVVWHQKPIGQFYLLPSKPLEGTLHEGRFSSVVSTQRGRGLLFFDDDGGLIKVWYADEEAKQQIDLFEHVFQNCLQIDMSNSGALGARNTRPPYSTTRDFIKKLREQPFSGYEFSTDPPKPLDSSFRSFQQRYPNEVPPYWTEDMKSDPNWLAFLKNCGTKENLALEDAIYTVFKERVSSWSIEWKPHFQAVQGSPSLDYAFSGKKGMKSSLHFYSQNFIVPDKAVVERDETKTGTIQMSWDGKPLYTKTISRYTSGERPYILFDGYGVMFLEEHGDKILVRIFAK